MFHVAIFDLNGTILDDEWLWKQSFERVFRSEGGSGTPQTRPGVGILDNWKHITSGNPELKRSDIEVLVRKTLDDYSDHIDDVATFRKGVVEYLQFLDTSSVAIALATSSSERTVQKIAHYFPTLFDVFSVVVHGDEVQNRKPAPDIFLKALEKVNAVSQQQYTTHDCVVFEDSNAGVQAAKSAKMYVVHLPNGLEQSIMTPSPDLVAKDFTDKRIYKLFEGGGM